MKKSWNDEAWAKMFMKLAMKRLFNKKYTVFLFLASLPLLLLIGPGVVFMLEFFVSSEPVKWTYNIQDHIASSTAWIGIVLTGWIVAAIFSPSQERGNSFNSYE